MISVGATAGGTAGSATSTGTSFDGSLASASRDPSFVTAVARPASGIVTVIAAPRRRRGVRELIVKPISAQGQQSRDLQSALIQNRASGKQYPTSNPASHGGRC